MRGEGSRREVKRGYRRGGERREEERRGEEEGGRERKGKKRDFFSVATMRGGTKKSSKPFKSISDS